MEKKFNNMKWVGILLVLTMLMVAPMGVAATVCSPVCPEGTMGDGSRKAGSGMATDDELESQKAMLRTMLAQLSTVCDMLYHQLGEKATPEEAPELYAKLDNIKMQIAMLGAQIETASTMEDIMVIQGSFASLQAALVDLKMQIENFVPGKQLTATTVEGVTMKFKVLDETEKTAMVGTGNKKQQAVDWNTTGKVTIPADVSGYRVTEVSEYAFYECKKLTEVVMPSCIQSIKSKAFYRCLDLNTLFIPENVSFIDADVFFECVALESISVAENNLFFDSRNNCNALIKKSDNVLIKGCKNTVIPNTVRSIGNQAFRGISSLAYINIPEGMEHISAEAFYACTRLRTISIPSTLKTIASNAFAYCEDLENFSVNESSQLYNIGSYAFRNCDSLKKVTLPASLTSIDNLAFSYCPSLKEIHSEIVTPFFLFEDVFYSYNEDTSSDDYSVYDKAVLFVPKGCVNTYKETEYWNRFKTILEEGTPIPTGVKAVAENNRTNVETYTLGGQRVDSPVRGMNVIKMSDGTVRKVLVK